MQNIFDKQNLDAEEKELQDSLEKGEWISVDDLEKEKKLAKQAATNYLKKKHKERRISIRIFAKDLERLREIAEEEGLPYQTLITSVLHKFTIGKLVSKDFR